MRTMLFAPTFHARPDRIGRVNESTSSRWPCRIESYNSLSTANADPAVGRYAGRGGGIGFRVLWRDGGEVVDMST